MSPYTPAQWAIIQKNAAQRLAQDPNNPRLLQALHDAYAALRQPEHAEQSDSPGPVESGALGFGEGASSGLASRVGGLLPGPSNTERLAQARSAHPWVTGGADLAGGTALAILTSRLPGLRALGPTGQGFTVGGLTGAARGGVEGGPMGALLGGGIGGLAGYAGGKLLARAIPAGRAIGDDLRSLGRPKIAPNPDATLRASLQKAGVSPEYLDAAVAATKRAASPPSTGGVPTTPEQAAPDALRNLSEAQLTALQPQPPMGLPQGPMPAPPVTVGPMHIAKSYAALKDLLRKGIPEDQIKIDYWTRGGRLEQTIPPLPSVSPKGSLTGASYADLRAGLTANAEGSTLHTAILKELQRRGIMGPGLLGVP